MRAAAILGLSSSSKHLHPFTRNSDAEWQLGLPICRTDVGAVVVFGGDGTVHRHLEQLVRLQLPVLVVPRGSGNDFARALGLNKVADSLLAWRQFISGKGKVRQIDLGVVSPQNTGRSLVSGLLVPDSWSPSKPPKTEGEKYFCCIGGVGLDSEIARRANRLPRWVRSHGGYALGLLPALLNFKPMTINLHSAHASSTFGPFHYQSVVMMAAFANAPGYGGGIQIAPRAQFEDGKLDICLVEHMRRLRLLRLFPSVYSGSHLNVDEVKYFQTESLRIETDRPVQVYADGEYICDTPIEVRVERKALPVIVPA